MLVVVSLTTPIVLNFMEAIRITQVCPGACTISLKTKEPLEILLVVFGFPSRVRSVAVGASYLSTRWMEEPCGRWSSSSTN